LQNEIPEPANLAAAGAANADGAFVIMNAAPARAMANALLDRLDCLVVNRIEAEMLSGDPVRDPADAASALSKFGGRIRNVIVTLGGEGLIIKSADDTISQIAAKRVEVVSSHGAGDCFVGALAAKVASGASLTEAAEFANAAAAAHVARQR
jgi:ribokinase